MNGGIAKVGCDGILPVPRVNAPEVMRHLVKSFVPSDALPTVSSATDGIFEPVFIVVQILQGDGLRADVPAAEWVVFVTAYVQTLVSLNRDFDATYRFAKIAVAIMKGAIFGGSHGIFRGNFQSLSHLEK
jgi:hypothetical protein